MRTPLYDAYSTYPGVKMIDFAGWEMPLHFAAGIIAEHRRVREAAGLFDVSHMGELLFEGPGSVETLDWLVTNDVRGMDVGQALYSPMCTPDGGTIDDLIIYRLASESFMVVVNAANTAKDLAWMKTESRRIRPTAVAPKIVDRSREIALLAFQGPKAEAWLSGLAGTDLSAIRPFRFASGVLLSGVEATIARTGYTGEDGFELFVAADDAVRVWRAILDACGPLGALPCGLGARDSLRIEARLPLFGQELDASIGPLEAGLASFVKMEKGEFCGRAALQAQKERGLRRVLRGCEMIDRGVPRHGYLVYADRSEIGIVTSGERSPTLDTFIGLVLISREWSTIGTEIEIDFGGRRKRARVVKTPFYRRRRSEHELSE